MSLYEKASFLLYGHTGHVFSIAHTSAGTICSGSSDHSVRTWDIEETICDRVLLGHEGTVGTLSKLGTQLVSGATDGQIIIWDTRSANARVKQVHAHNSDVNCIDNIDEHTFVSGSSDMSLKIWDVRKLPESKESEFAGYMSFRTDDSENRISSSHGTVYAVRVGQVAGKRCFFTCCRNGVVSAIDEDGISVLQYEGHYNDATACGVSNKKLITGSSDKTVRIFDMESGKCEKTFTELHSGPVRAIHVKKDVFYSASNDGTIKEVDLETNTVTKTIERWGMQVQAVHSFNDTLYCGCDEEVIRAFSLK
jgi:WD40 repeat protein